MIGALTIPKNKVQLARAITNSNIKSVPVLNDVTKIEVSDKNNSIEKFIGRSVGTIIVVKDDAFSTIADLFNAEGKMLSYATWTAASAGVGADRTWKHLLKQKRNTKR